MQKTFDQILQQNNGEIDGADVRPHKVIPANVVLEPNTHQGISRVRVTARDANFKLLWGVNISEDLMHAEHPTPVGVYTELRSFIRQHLSSTAPRFETTDNPFTAVSQLLSRIQDVLEKCKKNTMDVKLRSEQTEQRAKDVADILRNAFLQMTYELDQIGILTPPKTDNETRSV